MRILLAEADALLAASLQQQLTREQYAVQVVSAADEAQRVATEEGYDFFILDVEPLYSCALDLLRQIKTKRPELPVLFLSGALSVEERVRALDAGADDCLTKPIVFAELAARIRAVLRRRGHRLQAVLTVADLALNRVAHTVERCGRSVDLSPREFALLEFLMQHAGKPVPRTAIVENVWKTNFDLSTNVVDVYINYLRRKIDNGFDQTLIHTIRGVGYQIGENGLCSSAAP